MFDQEIWRWDGSLNWHYYTSSLFEAHNANSATNDFLRVHHLRTCLYFGVATIESLLNLEMRLQLESQDKEEFAIVRALKRPPLGQKVEKWPSELFGEHFSLGADFQKVFGKYQTLRNEITHPKRRDFAIYVELEKTNPNELTDTVAKAIVRIREAKNEPFPYWVLGWNFVGMNGDPTIPFESNNMNGFFWSLAAMGYNIDMSDVHWDKHNMIGVPAFQRLKEALSRYPDDIEPYDPRFPQRPRLTRRWWDRTFISDATPGAR